MVRRPAIYELHGETSLAEVLELAVISGVTNSYRFSVGSLAKTSCSCVRQSGNRNENVSWKRLEERTE
jgi:hypothetical protein